MVKSGRFMGGANNKHDRSHLAREKTLTERRELREAEEANYVESQSQHPDHPYHQSNNHEECTEIKKLHKELKEEKRKVARLEESLIEKESMHSKAISQLNVSNRVIEEQRVAKVSTSSVDAKSVIDDLVVKLSQLNQDGKGIRDESALSNACNRLLDLLDSTIKLSCVDNGAGLVPSGATAKGEQFDNSRMTKRVRHLQSELEAARFAISRLSLLPEIVTNTPKNLEQCQVRTRALEEENQRLLAFFDQPPFAKSTSTRSAAASIFAIHSDNPKWMNLGGRGM